MYTRKRDRDSASMEQPPRLPLVTTIQNRDESFDRDARLVNAFAELEPVSKDYWIQKRVGLASYATYAGNGLGMYNWNGNVYAVFGTSLLKDGVVFGTVDGSSRYVFQQLLGTGWLVLNNGVKAYYTDGTTLNELAAYLPVLAGAFIVGNTYEIVSAGTTDFTTLGSSDNLVGTQFVATNLGDPTTTGTAALGAVSLLAGVTYKIYSLGSTNFTTIGAASNAVGVEFVATGPGTGTGSVEIPNFPATFVKGWAYLDGTLYVMDHEARIWGTATLPAGGIGGLDDPRVWDPVNMLVARIDPGEGVTLTKHLNYVVALKQWTSEAFYDAANVTGSPLRSVQGAQSVYGCASADSVQEIDGTVVWLTFNRTVSPQIARMDDLRATIISTPPIERLLDQISFADIFSWTLKHGGHRFYGLTIKQSNLTLVYDLDQSLWYQWTDPSGNYWPIVSRSFTVNNKHIMQHETNGQLYYVEGDYEYPNDAGELFAVDIYTPNFDWNVDRRKVLNFMRFNTDQMEGSKLQVRSSDDDYQTWTNFREVNLANKRPVLIGCGTFYRRAWHIRHYANTPLRLKSIDLQLGVGTL